MVKGFKAKYNSTIGCPRIDNKVATKYAPLIGFEWEIPLDYDILNDRYDYDEDLYDCDECNDLGLGSFCNPRSIPWHEECGCLEVSTPVANTISSARVMAKAITRWVSTKDFLGAYTDYTNDGGIHVSVSNPIGDNYFGQGHSLLEVYSKLNAMLNRSSSAKFLWAFSGRGLSDNYSYQAAPERWDSGLGDKDFWDEAHHQHDNYMLKKNTNRIEYRIWHNHHSRLIPAIEFAHSTYLFCLTYKETKHHPYLSEYKAWLFKQKGYKHLKETADWSLIND